jgi:hypothetical protein
MKIWNSYSGEHSAKLKIIGTFKSVEDATTAENLFHELYKIAEQEKIEENNFYQDPEFKIIAEKYNFYSATFQDIKDLVYFGHSFERDRNKITIFTDDLEVQGLIKILIDNSAKIELYSKHDYPI